MCHRHSAPHTKFFSIPYELEHKTENGILDNIHDKSKLWIKWSGFIEKFLSICINFNFFLIYNQHLFHQHDRILYFKN